MSTPSCAESSLPGVSSRCLTGRPGFALPPWVATLGEAEGFALPEGVRPAPSPAACGAGLAEIELAAYWLHAVGSAVNHRSSLPTCRGASERLRARPVGRWAVAVRAAGGPESATGRSRLLPFAQRRAVPPRRLRRA